MTSSIPVDQSTVVPAQGTAILSLNLASGTLIVNNSTTTSVWVSTSTSVTPGYGYEITPQGSITWQYDGNAVYACADAGAVAPVPVLLTSAFTNPSNPLTEGLIIATELAAQGIPSPILETQLYNGQANTPVTFDCSEYASLSIGMTGVGGVLSVIYTDVSGAFTIGQYQIYILNGTNVRVPVMGPNCTVQVVNTGGASLIVIGSNRQLDDLLLNPVTSTIASIQSTTAITGVQQGFAQLGSNLAFNQQLSFSWAVPTSSVGQFIIMTGGGSGVNNIPVSPFQFISDTGAGHTVGSSIVGYGTMAAPRSNVTFWYRSSTPTTATIVQMSVWGN